MTTWSASPARTYALVVGIERYAAGEGWNLNGPSFDACKFADWLSAQGVPTAQITLCVEPLDENRTLTVDARAGVRPATRQEIERILFTELKQRRGDLLVIYWSGHGMITEQGERRLFFSDATEQNLHNLNLSSLMRTLRSTDFAGLQRQVGVIDSCANFISDLSGSGLPASLYQHGAPLPSIEQFFLFASRPGEIAKNSGKGNIGQLTDELLTRLGTRQGGSWPPDLEGLARQLRDHFISLREQKMAHQTPSYYWFRNWDGSEQLLGDAARPAASVRYTSPQIGLEDLERLVKSFASTKSLASALRREQVLEQLRPEIRWTIDYDPAGIFHVRNIITTCLKHQGGLAELLQVISIGEDPATLQGLTSLLGGLGLAET